MSPIPQPVPSIRRLKQQAKDLKKATGESHCHCLEAIAQRHGFKTWAALLAASQGAAQ